jgi:hypothetical protein
MANLNLAATDLNLEEAELKPHLCIVWSSCVMADSPEMRDSAAAGKGLFDFSFGIEARGDRSGHSVSDHKV